MIGKEQIFRSRRELVEALELAIPISEDVALTNSRCVQCYRAILAEGISAWQSVLDLPAVSMTVQDISPGPSQRGRVVGRSRGSYGQSSLTIVSPTEDIQYSLRALGNHHPHLFSRHFSSQVHSSVSTALDTVASLHLSRARSASTDEAYEMLCGAIQDNILMSAIRELLSERLTGIGHFMLGHIPFSAPMAVSTSVWQWIKSIAARTSEGSPIRTGIVLEASAGALKKLRYVKSIDFQSTEQFDEALSSAQTFALANGTTTFLKVSPDFTVTGIACVQLGLEARLKDDPDFELQPPVETLWIQALRPQSLHIFGTSGNRTVEIGVFRRGVFKLYDRHRLARQICEAIGSVVEDGLQVETAILSVYLVERATAGRGTGVLIGTGNSLGGKRLKQPVPLARNLSWGSFLDPDGAAIFDKKLRLHEYASVFLQPTPKMFPAKGTRHNALAYASQLEGCIGIALSDDGTISVYKNGSLLVTAL